MSLLKKMFGSKNEREVKKLQPIVDKINELETKFEQLTDQEIKNKTIEFRRELAKGRDLDQILPAAFAIVREAGKRTLNMRHYDVQMIGGIVLHQGKIAEMKTGEGKTLVATLPVYLNALDLSEKWIKGAKEIYGDDPDNWNFEFFYKIKIGHKWKLYEQKKAYSEFGDDPDMWENSFVKVPVGKGAHVVTVNDYLAKRDAEWMGNIYQFLGMKVGIIVHGLTDDERKENYGSDISYGTNNEFGFDYLRDNMKYDIEDYVQREHAYCIVDEVDSILIDEARTPLIISGPTESNVEKYYVVDKVVRKLKEELHYTVDIKDKLVLPTDAGVVAVEKYLNITNLYDPSNIELLHHVEQSLKAHAIFKEGIDYVVQGGKVIIVDEFTGRLMDGRRWSDGLHQAVEAKEAVDTPMRVKKLLAQGVEIDEEDQQIPEVENENQTLATITFQNYFRMYDKLSGMTGTADTEATEFSKIYKLDVVVIPTNKPVIRKDEEDLIYRDEDEKMDAIVEEIKRVNATGQPILVGTISIESSEHISDALTRANIPHNVLNAKNHKGEASIVAQAGRYKAVTVATNMAGRGTDIVLGGNPEFLSKEAIEKDIEKMAEPLEGEEYNKYYDKLLSKYREQCSDEKKKVLNAGGLYILGTERHESRRIDNQLRGRSGRQGDPGKSRFFISLQDDLMRRFGGEKIGNIMSRLGYKKGQPITHKMISKSIESAQKKVEAIHFDIRKNVLEYDDVMNVQRDTIYTLRKNLLDGVELQEKVFEHIEEIIISIVDYAIVDLNRPDEWNRKYIKDKVKDIFDIDISLKDELGEDINDKEKIEDIIFNEAEKRYKDKIKELGEDNSGQIERYFYLQSLDQKWKEHLLTMDLVKESIGLRGYAQKDPKIEYKKEGYRHFVEMLYSIKEDFIKKILRVQLDESHFEEDLEYQNQIEFMNEELANMYQSISEIEGPEDEKMKLIDDMNAQIDQLNESRQLKGFDFEKEREEYNQLMSRMQQGVEALQNDSDIGGKDKRKKKVRKFNKVSRDKKKKLKKGKK